MGPLLLVAAAACTWACGGSDAPDYCEVVSPILDAKCRRCHSTPPVNGAPMSLEGYDAVEENAPRMKTVIEIDFMPYRGDPTISPTVEDLTEEEEALVVEWLGGGTPRGSGSCE